MAVTRNGIVDTFLRLMFVNLIDGVCSTGAEIQQVTFGTAYGDTDGLKVELKPVK